ncbi:cobalamin biosynthesis protein [Paracoccus sp. SMMA_5_TC]|uniref:cobalamin biosynthesis protein n=1 Tax=Paracoccus sp. SMMA_5_TC TaxID=2654280 RepID=UPI0021E18EF1|nr:cobalamin biosynthesis protein [Paracoccus sp. SMMA_5_TC]UXU81885.1 cobalamin biosynthesis protein [Paracoccus sp. SMMA_5_TC]
MKVAGLGFRAAAAPAALAAALDRACALAGPPQALAAPPDKAAAPALRELARERGLPILAVAVAGIATPTQSPRVQASHATGSVAEAAALAALAPGARLLTTRILSPDRMACCAIAEGEPS